MSKVKVRAHFKSEGEFGFYGTQRRKNGDEFYLEYEDEEDLQRKLGSWLTVVDKPKKKPGPKPKSQPKSESEE